MCTSDQISFFSFCPNVCSSFSVLRSDPQTVRSANPDEQQKESLAEWEKEREQARETVRGEPRFREWGVKGKANEAVRGGGSIRVPPVGVHG